jgi:hypothetical protein
MATIVTKNGAKYEGVLDLNNLTTIERGVRQFTPKFIFTKSGYRYIEEHVRNSPNDAIATYNYILSKIITITDEKIIESNKRSLRMYKAYLTILGVKFDAFTKRAEALPTLTHESLEEFIKNL